MKGISSKSVAPKVLVQGVSKTFEKGNERLLVLDRVDLEVAAGEFICLLGPSGCGKSTLLNVCAGFERFDSGRVEIDGLPVTGPDPRRIFVFQEYGIFPWMSVWDNIAFGLGKRAKEERHAIVQRYVDMVGLTGFERAYPRQLSGGMKQRVEVARALAVDPDVLFMDEAFGALDSLTRLSMRAELIRIWEQEQRTILFVTHDVDESIQLADRIVVMSARPGRIADIVEVGMPHPRELAGAEYAAIKNRLYGLLGVAQRI